MAGWSERHQLTVGRRGAKSNSNHYYSRISKGTADKCLGQRRLSDGAESKDGHLAVHNGRLVLWHRPNQDVAMCHYAIQ